MMADVVEISDSEDTDDCVINSVTFLVDDEPESELYHEACNENQLLGNFIKKCLKLENSECMQKVLKETLLRCYSDADKKARESPRIQKNLRRAIFLLRTDPMHKFTHIKDLCSIFKALRVKKRVPFVTLTTNDADKSCDPIILETNSAEHLDVINGTNKETKLDNNHIIEHAETDYINFNDTCDILEESMSMEICTEPSSLSEEGKLLIPKRHIPTSSTSTEQKLKAIENKILYFQKKIAILEELEVDDDSENSPYIQSERLKTRIVSLYKKRCQLLGSQPVKRKGIRLKLVEGHPPGPTRVLERFLNKHCNKDGEPLFPDFCDVTTCVTEANDKDNLGWTKAQILNEASALFTLCGKALQKRRQNREYRDLIYKVNLEDLEKDPADDDPELNAKLERNKVMAIKKESDILERYTMMQHLPPKSKVQTNIKTIENSRNENTGENNGISGAQEELLNNDNNTTSVCLLFKSRMEESGNAPSNCIDKCMIISSKSNADVEKQEYRDTLHNDVHESVKNCRVQKDNEKSISTLTLPHSGNKHNQESTPASTLLNNSDTKIEITNKRVTNNGADHIIKSLSHNKNKILNDICNKGSNFEKNTLNKNQLLQIESMESQVGHKLDEDDIEMFKIFGNNFTVTVEILNDS